MLLPGGRRARRLRDAGRKARQDLCAGVRAGRHPRPAASFYPSTYQPPPGSPLLIRNATLLTGTGTRLEHADLLLADGKISAVGTALTAPANASVVDGTGRWVTPGLIDIHSHLGVYPMPAVAGNDDGNEADLAQHRQCLGEHSVWPQDPGFRTALAGASRRCRSCPARPTSSAAARWC